jgi:hypothetical protein
MSASQTILKLEFYSAVLNMGCVIARPIRNKMIQSSLLLTYGVPVLDWSIKSKPTRVVLILDYENPNRLSVCGKSGLRKCVFDIKDFNSSFVYSNREDFTLTINVAKGPYIYKFASEAELDQAYSTILGNRYLHYALAEQKHTAREELSSFKTSVSALNKTIPLLLDSFLVICKYQLNAVSEMSLSSSSIPKHCFESIVRNYYSPSESDNYDHFLKDAGFSDKPVYDQKDLLSFLISQRLECEVQESVFLSDVR